jgi:transposase
MDLAPSIKERRPWTIMQKSMCHWNPQAWCVVNASGKIVREAKVASEPEALIGWCASLGLGLARIGLEAGPLSQWLYAAMKQAGLAVELLETRHVSDAFKAMPVKRDRNDARKIAQLMRLGWFRPVHCKSIAAQEIRAMLTARARVGESRIGRRQRLPPSRRLPSRVGNQSTNYSHCVAKSSW